VISGFRRSINKISMFLDLMQRRMLLASYRRFEQPIGSIFKGQAVLYRLSRNVGKKLLLCAA
jgi:hypothetical protein